MIKFSTTSIPINIATNNKPLINIAWTNSTRTINQRLFKVTYLSNIYFMTFLILRAINSRKHNSRMTLISNSLSLLYMLNEVFYMQNEIYTKKNQRITSNKFNNLSPITNSKIIRRNTILSLKLHKHLNNNIFNSRKVNQLKINAKLLNTLLQILIEQRTD